jgi:hypothetical protein
MSRPQSNALYGKAIVAAQRPCRGISPTSPALAVIEIAAELHHPHGIASRATSCGKPARAVDPPRCYWVSTALSRRILQRGLANSLDAELGGGVLPHHSGIRGSGTLALRNRASASQALVAINRSAGVVTPMTPSTVIVARWRL